MSKATKYKPFAGQHKARALWQDLMNDAAQGDESARKIVADRLYPKLRPVDEPKQFTLLGTTASEKADSILTAVAKGQLAISEGTALISALAQTVKIHEVTELEARVNELEARK